MLFLLFFVICAVYGGETTSWKYMDDPDILTLVGNLTSLPRDQWNTEAGFQLCLSQAEETLRQGRNMTKTLEKVREIAKSLYETNKDQTTWPRWFHRFEDIEFIAQKELPDGTERERALLSIVLYLNFGDFIVWGKKGIFTNNDPYLDADIIKMFHYFVSYGNSFVFLFGKSQFFNCFENLLGISREQHIFLILEEWSGAQDIKAHGEYFKGLASVFEHDGGHTGNIRTNVMLMDTVKKGLHSDLTKRILCNIHRLWKTMGLEMTFAGHLIMHEDFVGKAALKDCEKDLSGAIISGLHENIWSRDPDGVKLLDRLLNGRPRSEAMQWRRELLDAACAGLRPEDQKGQQEAICQKLSRSWGIEVSIDRESHQALAIKLMETICEIEHLSYNFRNVLAKEIEKAFALFSEKLEIFVLVDYPVDLESVIGYKERYLAASFPTKETIESKDCSSQQRLLFLKRMIEEIKGNGRIVLDYPMEVGFAKHTYPKVIYGRVDEVRPRVRPVDAKVRAESGDEKFCNEWEMGIILLQKISEMERSFSVFEKYRQEK